MMKKNSNHSMNPSLTDQQLGKLIIEYCQAKNDGNHALAEQLIYDIRKLKESNNDESTSMAGS